ncbi:potassium channel family protein [Marinobacter sp. OP 3.4]|uniref:potassium channel family protein n=1 Tax=Marinobacter sp. OP 3.4 TaxID=3076501 RepID=UPI002E1F1F6E
MLPNRRPLNPEHQLTHLPMSGIIRSRLKRLFLFLIGLVLTQTLILWAVEPLSLWNSLWLTMTTLTTVGYGDLAPTTVIGRISTMALMFITAITLLTLIISDYIEYRFYRRERILTGRWRYNMKNHVLIINTPRRGGEQYFMRVATQLRAIPGYESVPIMILTQKYANGLPPELKDIGLVHYHGTGASEEDLKAAHAGQARHILLLALDETDPSSDSYTFDIAHRLSELNLASKITAECVSDSNRQRFRAIGVRSVIRPVRTYPEIMVRAVVAPGTEKVLEDMFNYEQDHPHRYNLTLDDLTWSDIVSALIRHGIGTALAYIDDNDDVVCHPEPNIEVEGRGLIVLVKSSETPDLSVVEEALERYRQFLDKWQAMHEHPEEPAR